MKIYIVRPGDSLYAIARRFGVSVNRLVYDNQIADPDRIAVGRALVIDDGSPGGTLGRTEAAGYAYPTIRESVLNESLPALTYLLPFTWRVEADGGLVPPGGRDLVTPAWAAGVAPLMSVANTVPGGGFSREVTAAVLNDPAARERMIREITAAVDANSYYGVVLDLEYVGRADRDAFSAFTRDLAAALHPMGAVLGVALAPKTSADQKGTLYEGHDYRAQGEAADFLYLMTYEWGYLYGQPMAVSPIGGVRSVLDYAVTEVPPEKLVMGLSNYGYDWTLPWRQGVPAKLLSNPEAANLADRERVAIQYDTAAQAPWFRYRDDAGALHEVWFEDARSIRARLRLVPEYGLRGIFWWNMNRLFRAGLLTYASLFDTAKIF